MAEELPAIADEEQPYREEQHPADDERSDRRKSRIGHINRRAAPA
jgi:hypothetical protein